MSSYGRTKVLTIMLETGELNISEIKRRSGLSHSATARHLDFLTRSGILTEKRFNRIRIFRIDQANPLAAALMRFYSDWKEIGEHYGRGYN
ncbi:MAG TPA: winged helix-turn-helix domain-containing protein [Nitrososphaerales archaeon]|nr:winged helix-turn-helix domain-containing protein [Nitrososphaerales archaeon]